MPICVVCGSEDFDVLDGLYYCTECSTQSQEIREVELDDDFGGTSWQVRSIVDKTRRTKKAEKEPEVVWRTVDAFNIIIHKQAEAFIALGAHPRLSEVVFQLWSCFLRRCEQAFVSHRQTWKPKLLTQSSLRDLQVALGREVQPGKVRLRLNNRIVLSTTFSKAAKMKKKGNHSKTKLKNEKEEVASDEKAVEGTCISLETQETSAPAEDRNSEESPQKLKKRRIKSEHHESSEMLKSNNSRVCESKDKKADNVAEACKPRKRHGFKFSAVALTNFEKKKDKRRKRNRTLADTLTLVSVLSLCCLGLRITGETILLSDVCRWVAEGHIPFYHAYTLLPSNWKLHSSDVRKHSTKFALTATLLEANLHRVLNLISLPRFSMLPVSYVVSRYIADLNLPHEIVAFTSVLLDLFPPVVNKQVGRFVEMEATTYILCILKYLFGLDDSTEKTLSEKAKEANTTCEESGISYFVWTDWAEELAYIQTHQEMMDPFSNDFSATDCADTDNYQAAYDNFVSLDPNPCRKREIAVQKVFGQLNLQQVRSCSEPPNSFPIRTIMRKKYKRIGKDSTDYSRLHIHSRRSRTYWLCHDWIFLEKGIKFPKSFMLLYDIFYKLLGVPLRTVIRKLKTLENRIIRSDKLKITKITQTAGVIYMYHDN